MLIVAGITLKQLQPRVWDPSSPYHLPNLQAVMVSYADFHRMPARRRDAMEVGLHRHLGVPDNLKIYLDNGSFYFIGRDGETSRRDYEEFVQQAQPDWWPVPQDFIPTPKMADEEQTACLQRTMAMNLDYGNQEHEQFTPVIHISQRLDEYVAIFQTHPQLLAKSSLALGGIVPNLLRASKALPHARILASLSKVRRLFPEKHLHVFGIGGTATLHVAALLGMDSVDSSGWRNRAARGLVQLPGTGDRSVAKLGNWRGREPSDVEWDNLAQCPCPACVAHGLEGLRADKAFGFSNRATHNLWVLLNEVELIERHLNIGSYQEWYPRHLDNTIYQPLIDALANAPDFTPDERTVTPSKAEAVLTPA